MDKKLFIINLISLLVCACVPRYIPNYSTSTNFEGVELWNRQRSIKWGNALLMERIPMDSIEDWHCYITYEGNDLDKARADIRQFSKLDTTSVLHFRINEPNVLNNDGSDKKARIQFDFTKKKGFIHFVSQVDCYIPQTLSCLMDYDSEIGWLTIQEYWNDSPNDNNTTFRLRFGIHKDEGTGKPLYFNLIAQDYINKKFKTVGTFQDSTWCIPLGEWFSIRTEVHEGDASTGYVHISVKRKEDRKYTTIINGPIQTHSSYYNESSHPWTGYQHLNPMKLYTSPELINYLKKCGVPCELYFTNWKFDGKTL